MSRSGICMNYMNKWGGKNGGNWIYCSRNYINGSMDSSVFGSAVAFDPMGEDILRRNSLWKIS